MRGRFFSTDRGKRIALKVIGSALLIGLPFFYSLYYIELYFVLAALWIILSFLMEVFHFHEKWDERFCDRWRKKRDEKRWILVISQGFWAIVVMAIIVSIGQFFGDGRTPLDVIDALSNGALLGVGGLLIGFGIALGAMSWYDKEKRYRQLCGKKAEETTVGNILD